MRTSLLKLLTLFLLGSNFISGSGRVNHLAHIAQTINHVGNCVIINVVVKATLYSLDSEEECRELLELSHDERCQVFNVFDESDNYGVLPGAAYHTYEFVFVGGILTMYDTLALNV